ncbi:MAG: hypothetical protein HQ518_20510 [Rhodopirellula sp.]|nr:hypothetical protein [Rhodopirellula sp.]
MKKYGQPEKIRVVVGSAVVGALAAMLLFVFGSLPDADTPDEPLRVLKSDAEVLTKLSLSNDGNTLAAASANGEVVVWRLPGQRSIIVGRATGSAATMLTWSPDGLLLSGDSSGLLRGWQQPDLKESRIDSPQVPVTACVFRQKTAQKQMLLGLSDGRVVQIDPSETKLRDSGHRGVKAMLISSDQTVLISAGSEGKLIWYDMKLDNVLGTASEHDTEIAALAWSPDGIKFISADWNGELRLWDANKRKLIASAAQPDAVSAMAWTAEQLVTGSWDGRIRVWNVASNQIELAFSIDTGQPIHSLVVESSGETAFTVSGDRSVRAWALSPPATDSAITP